MVDTMPDLIASCKARLDNARLRRRWHRLKAKGLQIGQGVNLPASTWIDPSHCFLIGIGDWCGFGEQCMVLAHDGQMDEFLDAGLVGRITIHESCHFGSRTVILPGVEIGPRTIVGANSVVSKSLPPDTVCAGVPARVICSLEDYLARHRAQITQARLFPWSEYGGDSLTLRQRQDILGAIDSGPVYITGGFSEELQGHGGTERTPYDQTAKPHGMQYLKELLRR
jgi:maltose O-acetyltransferase